MNLGKVAERWVNEPLEGYDEENDQFYPLEARGRVSLTDRFLSNFNRPLRRRMLHYSPGAELPESCTFRLSSTQDVYLVGQTRTDSDAGSSYHSMAVCHLVTDEGEGSSAGKVELYRYLPEGPEEDPGWLKENFVARHFADLEFRASLNESDLPEERIESFIAWLPRHAELEVHDFLRFKGVDHRITDVYSDSGFMMCRLDREAAYFVDLVFHVKGDVRYDKDLMRYVSDEADYNVTGRLTSSYDYAAWVTDSDSYVNFVIDDRHIGFEPKTGMEITYKGVKRTIRYTHYHRGERQYQLRVR